MKQNITFSEQYEKARKSAISHLKSGFHLGGKIKVNREEFHERQGKRKTLDST